MLLKSKVLACLGMVGVIAALPVQAAIINDTFVGTTTPTSLSNSGTVGTSFTDTIPLSVGGTVPKFNIAGAVLLSYIIFGDLVVTSDGTITIGTPNSSSGGNTQASIEIDAVKVFGFGNDDPDSDGGSCGSDATGVLNCDEAQASSLFAFNIGSIFNNDFGNVLGTGTVQVTGSGLSIMSGGCTPGVDPVGNCDNTTFTHDGSASLENLRVEYAYCDTPGIDGCPDLIPGRNTPGLTNGVPEPGTLALLGLGLAGLAAARRRRQ